MNAGRCAFPMIPVKNHRTVLIVMFSVIGVAFFSSKVVHMLHTFAFFLLGLFMFLTVDPDNSVQTVTQLRCLEISSVKEVSLLVSSSRRS